MFYVSKFYVILIFFLIFIIIWNIFYIISHHYQQLSFLQFLFKQLNFSFIQKFRSHFVNLRSQNQKVALNLYYQNIIKLKLICSKMHIFYRIDTHANAVFVFHEVSMHFTLFISLMCSSYLHMVFPFWFPWRLIVFGSFVVLRTVHSKNTNRSNPNEGCKQSQNKQWLNNNV